MKGKLNDNIRETVQKQRRQNGLRSYRINNLDMFSNLRIENLEMFIHA